MMGYFQALDRSVEKLNPPRTEGSPRLTAADINAARQRGRYLRGQAFRFAVAGILDVLSRVSGGSAAGPFLSIRIPQRRSGGAYGFTPPLSPP